MQPLAALPPERVCAGTDGAPVRRSYAAEMHMVHFPAGRARRVLLGSLLAALLALTLIKAPLAHGTIVWSKGGDIWAMNDDGSGQRLLVSKVATGMDALRTPAVSPAGAAVFFTGETARNKVTRTGVCGVSPFTYPCITTHFGFYASGTYRWEAGGVARLSPDPAYCFNCTDGTNDPEARPDGSYVASFMHCQGYLDDGSYECLGSIVASASGPYPAVCNGETLAGDMPAGPSPNPVAPNQIVYAGCAGGGEPSALIVTDANRAGERIVACDDATQADPSWSPSGQEIVAAEGGAEAGLWVYGAANNGCYSGQLREALSAPPGVSFSSPRFLGADRIAFAAQGELWTVPASCAGCAFPAAATQLTGGGDNASPAWTSNPLTAPGPAAGDTKAPKLILKLKKRQRVGKGGAIVLKLRCDEPCKVTVGGKILVPGKDVKLKKVSRSLKAGKLATVKMKLTAKALKAVRRAWRKHRKAVAKLSIAARDAAGNATKRSQRVTLVP